MNRRSALLATTSAAILSSGCPLSAPESLPPGDASSSAAADGLAGRIAATLDYELKSRGLSTTLNGAWQIFHGILAFGADFEVDTPIGRVGALDYFSSGGTCSGFEPRVGNQFDDGRFGLMVDIQAISKVGQGHRDQWLAVVSQAGVSLSDTWMVGDESFNIQDWLRQAQFDVPLNYEREYSWTLIPLALLRETDYRWPARDGNQYSVESLLRSEIDRDLAASVCGGTHRLIGIAFAVKKRVAEGRTLVGTWKDARDHLAGAIDKAKENQNPDGSYGTSYFHRTGWCQDLGENLGTTGHVLEFLAIAADDETLRSEWVQRIAVRVCEILRLCRGVNLECGVLYHALHGLVAYQQRVYS